MKKREKGEVRFEKTSQDIVHKKYLMKRLMTTSGNTIYLKKSWYAIR